MGESIASPDLVSDWFVRFVQYVIHAGKSLWSRRRPDPGCRLTFSQTAACFLVRDLVALYGRNPDISSSESTERLGDPEEMLLWVQGQGAMALKASTLHAPESGILKIEGLGANLGSDDEYLPAPVVRAKKCRNAITNRKGLNK